MDPVTVLGLVKASLSVTEHILDFCSAYRKAYKDLSSIIDLIEFECNTWKALIARLEDRLETDNPSGPPLNLAPFGVLEKVRDHLSQLDAWIRAQALRDETTKVARIVNAGKWLARDKRKVVDLLNELSPIKFSFSLALDVDSRYGCRSTSNSTSDLECHY
ncbi:uncharacterized protein PG998_008029 [Apiospora kogelbergensis]|uniref:Uncharacterized protein n=1 Tax=Apiospora kogelbergensis TaxID=1337665 RepID=A0AAW0QLC2_9PEZI